MKVYTLGFTQKSAREFFGLILKNKIEILIDIRLNNKSQLAGFTKGNDLEYFLKAICSCKYQHCINFAPTKEILDGYKKKAITWRQYEVHYTSLMHERDAVNNFFAKFGDYDSVCLLCSEPTPEHCHRRLFAEMLSENRSGLEIVHI